MSPGKGLVVHINTCRNIRRNLVQEAEKFLPVEWTDEPGAEYVTGLRIEIINHQGALAKLTSIIAGCDANIHNMNTEEKDGRIYAISLTLTVQDRIHLAKVIKKIRVMPEVIKATRARS